MKKILNIGEIATIIESKDDIYQVVGGKTYKLNFVSVLQMKLIDIIMMVKEGQLFRENFY